MHFKVIDDFLPIQVFQDIKSSIINNEFPWYYQEQVTGVDDKESTFYFTHIFYNNFAQNSTWYENIRPLVKRLELTKLIRVKGNFYPNLGIPIENEPHVDYKFENKAAVFYLNTNNGYTILKDGTKIESIENRILFFNGNEIHTSTHCTDKKYRANINFNYL